MHHPVRITASPDRTNIYDSVRRKTNTIEEEFGWLIDELKCKREKTAPARTIIYCTSVIDCAVIYNEFATEISEEEQYHPLGCSQSSRY